MEEDFAEDNVLSVQVPWRGQEVDIECTVRPSSRTDGLYLLCLHGAYCNRSCFRCIYDSEALSLCGLVAVDLPGHGGSTKAPMSAEEDFPAALEDMADVVLRLLAELKLLQDPCVVVAHSLGGAVGLLMSDRMPHLRSFVSIEGVIVASDTPEHGVANRWRRRDPKEVCAEDLLNEIASAGHLGDDAVGLADWRDCAERCGPTRHLLAIRVSASMHAHATSMRLPKRLMKLPEFHYMYGSRSGKFSDLLRDTLAEEGGSHCFVHRVAGAGHFLLLDSQEHVLAIVRRAVPPDDLSNCEVAHLADVATARDPRPDEGGEVLSAALTAP